MLQTLEDETVFINEVTLQDQTYSYLLFFPSKMVKRFVFHYNTQEIMTVHNIPLMITVNVLLTLVMSFIYATNLSRPLNGIIQNIVALSKGEVIHKTKKPSLYASVEERLDELALKLERAEFERQQMEALREEWIGNITHDIKTPLTSIRGNAEILGDEDYEITLEQRQLYAHVILQQADYIKTLVDDLNLSTRLKNGNLTLHQKPVNVVSLLREVVIDFLNNPRYEGYEIEFIYQEEYLVLTLDELLMKRVFINLMTNAMDHNPQGTKIKVDVQQKGQTIIKISDEGVGIKKEDLAHIFTRYYRGTNTTKSSQGSGLGLAIAYDIVKIHGGEIKASSVIGQGLEILITLK
ncbi:MAG TPA: sensor histidine kinase [Firmicutes bacterium]|nr:sensor histidine kinase [Bacillota bacterium]